ncbi:VapE domain-containing protein [Achromobacter pestifer]
MADRIDFPAIADAALARAATLVPQWLPGGRREGHEWRCGSIRGDAGTSFAVNLTTGVWADFASDSDRGGDLISLYAAIYTDGDQGRAARELSQALAMEPRAAAAPPRKAAAKRSPWAPVLPVPDQVPPPPVAHSVRGRPDMRWEYRACDGQLLGLVYRFRTSDGGKEVLPCVWAVNSEGGASDWRWMSFPEPRPLYALEHLRIAKTVLVVEGEKCVDAGRAELSEWFDVVSWPGGGKAVDKADWSPLRGRKVVIWPDCDGKRENGDEPEHERPLLPEEKQPGMRAANAVLAQVLAQDCMVRMVQIPVPGEKPDGWDIADAIAEGLTGRDLRDWIVARLREPTHDEGQPQVVPRSPEAASTPDRAGATDGHWTRRLLRKSRGGWEDCKENVAIALEDHPALRGLLAFNDFSGRIEKRRDPPWRTREGEWTEDDDRELGMWLGVTCELLIRSTRTVGEGVQIVANRNRHHPVREWLQSLVWDGKDRTSTWLRDCLGVEDSDYASLVGSLWLRQAVNRILHPGSKGDYALILEGSQGLSKSTALKRLGGEWFSDAPLDLNSKDSSMSLAGVWIYEIAELDAFNRAESTRIKAFMTMTEDRFRPPYGSRFISQPRQTVFAATTNNDEYHKDPTGNRRFWSVLCRRVDLDMVDRQREQMFAQAMAEVLEGKPCYPTRDEERRLIAPEQEMREIVDPWMEYIIRWVGDPERALQKQFSTAEILKGAIQMAADRMDGQRSAATRVGNCMKKLGWGKRRGSDGDHRPWVYVRPVSASPGGSLNNGAKADALPI